MKIIDISWDSLSLLALVLISNMDKSAESSMKIDCSQILPAASINCCICTLPIMPVLKRLESILASLLSMRMPNSASDISRENIRAA